MAVTAPLRIPVEIRRRGGARSGAAATGERWFRTARGVSELGLHFTCALPEAAEGPLVVSFVLPDDLEGRIELAGRAVLMETGEAGGATHPDDRPPERLAVRFLSPDEPSRARIARYVAVRVPASC